MPRPPGRFVRGPSVPCRGATICGEGLDVSGGPIRWGKMTYTLLIFAAGYLKSVVVTQGAQFVCSQAQCLRRITYAMLCIHSIDSITGPAIILPLSLPVYRREPEDDPGCTSSDRGPVLPSDHLHDQPRPCSSRLNIMSTRLRTHIRLLVAVLFLTFAWAGAGGGPSHAQNLPSWAEPQSQPERVPDRESRYGEPPNRSPDRSGDITSNSGVPGNIGGQLRPNNNGQGNTCQVDTDCNGQNKVCINGSCTTTTGTCTIDDDCNGNKTCVDGQCVNSSQIPIGGPWAPFWTGMLIVLGLAFGVYRLSDGEGELEHLAGTSQMTSRVVVFAGTIIGGTSVSSAYGFQVASRCASTLPPILPWGNYWIGLVFTAGLLGAAGRLYIQNSGARGQT